MDARAKTLILLVAGTILGFLLAGHGPIGARLYPASPMLPTPAGPQVALFLGLALIEALAFGLGLAILVDGSGLLRAAAPQHPGVARAAHLSLVWLLMSWVPHDALHAHVGMDLGGLLAIEYGFHATLIVAAFIAARYWFVTLEARAEERDARPTETQATTRVSGQA